MGQPEAKRKKRITALIIGVIVVFGSPIVFALALFLLHPQWMKHTQNHGYYIQPPLDFSTVKLMTTDGSPVSQKQWHKQWLVFYVTPLPCRAVCRANLQKFAQLQESFSPAVQKNLGIVVATFAGQGGDRTVQKFGDFSHVYLQRHNFITTFAHLHSMRQAMVQGMIYIVNPDDYVVVSYQTNISLHDIRTDLSKFLASTN